MSSSVVSLASNLTRVTFPVDPIVMALAPLLREIFGK